MRLLAVSFALMVLLVPVVSTAQQDVTPPVLLDFTASPAVFDTAQGQPDDGHSEDLGPHPKAGGDR